MEEVVFISEVYVTKELDSCQIQQLKELFDQEYQGEFGEWSLETPYGYAGHDFHVFAVQDGKIVGHVGSEIREIQVGRDRVRVAGIGGVLVASDMRGQGLGCQMVRQLTKYHREHTGVSFCYLECRDQVLPFYLSCGFVRYGRMTSWINRKGQLVREYSPNVLIAEGLVPKENFPAGSIDLCGRAW